MAEKPKPGSKEEAALMAAAGAIAAQRGIPLFVAYGMLGFGELGTIVEREAKAAKELPEMISERGLMGLLGGEPITETEKFRYGKAITPAFEKAEKDTDARAVRFENFVYGYEQLSKNPELKDLLQTSYDPYTLAENKTVKKIIESEAIPGDFLGGEPRPPYTKIRHLGPARYADRPEIMYQGAANEAARMQRRQGLPYLGEMSDEEFEQFALQHEIKPLIQGKSKPKPPSSSFGQPSMKIEVIPKQPQPAIPPDIGRIIRLDDDTGYRSDEYMDEQGFIPGMTEEEFFSLPPELQKEVEERIMRIQEAQKQKK